MPGSAISRKLILKTTVLVLMLQVIQLWERCILLQHVTLAEFRLYSSSAASASRTWQRENMIVQHVAGVYFEKYVKGKQGQTLWIRNLQLSIYGVPLAIVYCLLRDGRSASPLSASGPVDKFASDQDVCVTWV